MLAVVPLLASAYQFCRVDAKTDDHLFLGFPSYWNIAAFYVIVLDLSPTAAAAVLLVCAVLVFVPIGYVYPSRTTTLQAPTLVLTCLWLVSYAVLLAQAPDPSVVWLAISVAYVVYYVVLSLYLTARRGRPRAPPSAEPSARPARRTSTTSPRPIPSARRTASFTGRNQVSSRGNIEVVNSVSADPRPHRHDAPVDDLGLDLVDEVGLVGRQRHEVVGRGAAPLDQLAAELDLHAPRSLARHGEAGGSSRSRPPRPPRPCCAVAPPWRVSVSPGSVRHPRAATAATTSTRP